MLTFAAPTPLLLWLSLLCAVFLKCSFNINARSSCAQLTQKGLSGPCHHALPCPIHSSSNYHSLLLISQTVDRGESHNAAPPSAGCPTKLLLPSQPEGVDGIGQYRHQGGRREAEEETAIAQPETGLLSPMLYHSSLP